MKRKTLLVDLETFPNISYIWGKYEQNSIRFLQQTCIASFVAKWLDGPMIAKGLPDYAGYKPGSYDDKALCKDLWKLFDEAEVLVAHNGVAFDLKTAKARFLVHNLPPPSPSKSIDTKTAVKRVARFNSNKLDDLGELLGIGKKIKTDFDLWEGCINGDKKSWKKMIAYNKKDVLLLEKLYLRLRPWIMNHPNMTLYDNRAKCPKCSSDKIQYRGVAVTATGKYRRARCLECAGWFRETKRIEATTVTNLV